MYMQGSDKEKCMTKNYSSRSKDFALDIDTYNDKGIPFVILICWTKTSIDLKGEKKKNVIEVALLGL